MTPDPLAEIRRLTVQAAAGPIAVIASFVVAAVTVPLQGRGAGMVVASVLVLIVVAAGVITDRAAAFVVAACAALSFDFFHVEPIRVLHAGTLAAAFVAFMVLVLLAGLAHRRVT